MSRTKLFSLALAGIMMIAGAATSAHAEKSGKQPPDLSGQWRLDSGRSEMPERPGGGGWSRGPRTGGRGGGGFPGGRRGPGGAEGGDRPGGPDAGRGGRMMRLPDFLRIEQTDGFVRLEDSTGTAIEEIATRGGSADTTSLPPDVARHVGQWKGDRLEVKHEDGRGGTITETYTLEDEGRSLVLKTKIEGRRTFEFRRVFQRANAS